MKSPSPRKESGHENPFRVLMLAFPWSLAVRHGQAQDKFDPAVRAKVVAPFIDEQTVAVLHVDTSRMPVDALFAKTLEICPNWSTRWEGLARRSACG